MLSAALEAGHPVVVARHDQPVAEGLAGLAEGHVLEVLRQREDRVAVLVRRRPQVAVVAAPAARRSPSRSSSSVVPLAVRQRHVRAERRQRRPGHDAAGDARA